MFKGTVWNNKRKEAQAVLVSRLTLSKLTYAASTLKVRVKIRDVVMDGMLDTRAEVNIITKALADLARLTVWTNVQLGIKVVSRALRRFAGVYEDVEVNISSIVNLQTILVILDLAYHKLILG
jgi:hypothetical protein